MSIKSTNNLFLHQIFNTINKFFIENLLFIFVIYEVSVISELTTAMHNINICRPGFGASCALCCGSHNYNASKEEISILFKKRHEIFRQYNPMHLVKLMQRCRNNLTGSYYLHYSFDENLFITQEKLHEDGMQCPFVCLFDDGIVGCAIYPNNSLIDIRYDCFQNYTCKYFSCTANDILSDEEILYAARLFNDWYYYPIFIHSIDFLRTFKESHPQIEKIGNDEIMHIKNLLERQLKTEKNIHTIHSYFS